MRAYVSITPSIHPSRTITHPPSLPPSLSPHQIKHLQPKSDAGGIRNEEAHLLTNWLEQGVFDALSKRYLRAVVFAISVPVREDEDEEGREGGPEKVIETYQWKVGYTDEGEVTLNASRIAKTKAELKAQAIR
jgi:hypothetical protein